jgi:TolB-like protein/Tfp pilus assembly protein PilF
MSTAMVRLLKELRRRRVFRVAGLYVVSVWLLMQAADILFPGWGIPDAAIRYLLWAGLAGFPVALAFGWVFDITPEGIRRTQPPGSEEELLRSLPLRRADYLILSAFLVVVGAILYDTTDRVLETTAAPGLPEPDEWRASTAEIEPHSVAVLPFANLSADPEQDYFADGVSEEILNRLSAFGELKVIARTSSFVFKDSGYDIGRVSHLLEVNYLLQGSVRRDGQQLRIAAQLVDRSGRQVWSSTFDRELGGVFALQDEIAEAVATSIVPQIAPLPVEARLPDLDAYEAYLAGRTILARREFKAGERALAELDRAIELDPGFAEAWAERAVAQVLIAGMSAVANDDLALAQRDIDQALSLKPGLPRALAAQALLIATMDPSANFAEREALLRRSLAADPNQVDALNWLSGVLSAQRRMEEADAALARAVRLDPLAPSVNANMADREAARGDHEAAERRLLRLLDAPHAPEMIYVGLITSRLTHGQIVDAQELFRRYVLATAESTGRLPHFYGLIVSYTLLGLQEQAAYWYRRNAAEHPDDPFAQVLGAMIVSMDRDTVDAYAEARTLHEAGTLDLDRGGPLLRMAYGSLAALYDDHATAIRVLEPLFQDPQAGVPRNRRARHALAWSYLATGETDKARVLLEPLAEHDRAPWPEGEDRVTLLDPTSGYVSGGLAGRALTMQLMGDEESALTQLEAAVEAGWRGPRILLSDPRWRSLHGHPRFRALLDTLEAELAPQRARLAALDASEDFAAQLDAALLAAAAAQNR